MLQVPSILGFVSNPGAQSGVADRLRLIDRIDFCPARQQYRRSVEAHHGNVTRHDLERRELLLKLHYAAVVTGLRQPVPSPIAAQFWLAHLTADTLAYKELCIRLFGGFLHFRIAQGTPNGLLGATHEHYYRHLHNLPEDAVPGVLSVPGGGAYCYGEVEFETAPAGPAMFPCTDGPVMVAATPSP